MAVCPAVLDRDIAVFDKANLAQSITERCRMIGVFCGIIEKPDHRHRRLLRPRCERPRGRAAERDNEFSPSNVDCHVTLPRGGRVHAMEETISRFSGGRTTLLRCESLEPPMSCRQLQCHPPSG